MREQPGPEVIGLPDDPLLRKYLPPKFLVRLPADGRAWRGRMALLLWSLGYRIEHAWWLAVHAEGDDAREFEAMLAGIDDDRLRADLEATAQVRDDGSDVLFL